jgi:molybdopterin converting factor subunit 1
MQVRILYFAAVRELVGLEEETLVLPSTVRDVRALSAHLEGRHVALAGRLGAVRFAIDEAFAELDARLHEGAVVALIPPVAGGSGLASARERVAIRHEPLSIDAVMALVQHPGAGAVTLFLGTVRDHNAGREVTALEYSAYESMAVAEMARVVEELEREIPVVRLAVHHRVGMLAVGDAAVVCAASSPHRDEAFRAGRALIDRIKERVPIWKRELGPDGHAWVGWEDARCTPGHHEHYHHAHSHSHSHSHEE